MKKKYCLLLSIMIMSLLSVGCKNTQEAAAPTQAPEVTVIDNRDPENVTSEDVVSEDIASEDAASNDVGADDNITEDANGSDDTKEPENEDEEDKGSNSMRTIVWLGDSLTQGSLGEDNDNLAHAPYVKLQSLVPNKVEGYGLYGYNTHDIFWVYKDADHYHQTVDPDKIYIFWVGSNDWCPIDSENTNTAPVIAEIDSFLQSGGVKDYIVMGTTQRWRLGLERAQIINADLSAHYGSHYMEVLDIIAKNGFSEDNTHLSQASYDAIAEAVYGKLKALGYI